MNFEYSDKVKHLVQQVRDFNLRLGFSLRAGDADYKQGQQQSRANCAH